MSPWIPFDADPEEIAALHVIRDDIPESARPAILAWVWDRLQDSGSRYGHTSAEEIHVLQTSLGVNFGYQLKSEPLADSVLEDIQRLGGDRLLLRVIDLMVSMYTPDSFGQMPLQIDRLDFHLQNSSSAIELVEAPQGNYRLRRRLPRGVESAIQGAVDIASDAGRHLAEAWRSATAMTPNTSHAMAEAIRAVDVASGAVVIPKEKKPTIFKVVKVMRDQGDWGLVLNTSEGYPDHRAVLLGMLETLAKAQSDRHGGPRPSALEASAHVQLAATLVHWFASGAIVRTGPAGVKA